MVFALISRLFCILAVAFLSLQVNDLVKLGPLTLMIRAYYYLPGTYFYLDPVGGTVFPTNFEQFFWLVSVSILMALSCIMKSFLAIYDIPCVYDHIWQLYLRAISSNNPPGNDINFRISTSLHLPNIQFVVYSWVPRAILPLGIQGRNHHERMAYELSGAQNCYREPSVRRAWTERERTL